MVLFSLIGVGARYQPYAPWTTVHAQHPHRGLGLVTRTTGNITSCRLTEIAPWPGGGW